MYASLLGLTLLNLHSEVATISRGWTPYTEEYAMMFLTFGFMLNFTSLGFWDFMVADLDGPPGCVSFLALMVVDLDGPCNWEAIAVTC